MVESRESGNKEIPWFSYEDLHLHTKAFDGYIFTIYYCDYNELLNNVFIGDEP